MLNRRAGNRDVSELVDWALPIQQQHLETVRSGSLERAAEENPMSSRRSAEPYGLLGLFV